MDLTENYMKTKLYIVGAGSVGCHIAYNYNSYNIEYELFGFLDDDVNKIGKVIAGLKVLDNVDYLLKVSEKTAIIIGIAFPGMKKKIIERLSSNNYLFYPVLISSQVWISNGNKVGKGSIIYPGCSINYESVIGDFVVINMNCALGHHSIVGNYSSLAPGVNFGGHTTVGEGVDIGIGVSTIQNINIGSNSIIGGQSMLIEDVLPNSKIAGIPAKKI
jgi:sugar O-acyltransferase (sialic acid O-acetyltransferase NeuD family)